MRNECGGVLAAALILCGVIGSSGQQPTFRSSIDVVTVIVSVRSGNRVVTGLTSADFRLEDDGVEQKIDSSGLESVPLDITLLIDTSESVSGALQESLRAGVHQLAAALKPDDRVRLIAVSHALQLMPESEPAQLASVRLPDPRGGTSLYDGLALALIRPGPADRRHLIMAFTDGRDTTSITAPSALLPLSRASDAVAYIVAAGSGPTTTIQEPAGLIGDVFSAARSLPRTVSVPLTREHVDPEGTLGEVASTTGGDLLLLPEHRSLAGSFARILSDFRTSYVLTYGPAGVKAGGWHELKISVRRPGRYEVRARKGYSREARR